MNKAIPWRMIEQQGHKFALVDLVGLARCHDAKLNRLPYCLRVVLENLARRAGDSDQTATLIDKVARRRPGCDPFVVPLSVSRVILPDSSGLPALMDLAALRSALVRRGLPWSLAESQIPVDLVIDHSLIVEAAGHPAAEDLNVRREFERNAERYSFFKWAQEAFGNLRVIPPGMGIVHQVHIELLAQVVATEERAGRMVAFPEFVLGGDSHTPMVNALGVLGWGVGGIEAEAALLGEPCLVSVPRVVGLRLTGRLPAGATTTDLVLMVTQRLRQVGVIGAYVEYFGPGVASLSVPERATLANMAPEYGATIGFFPIDEMTLTYLRETGRTASQVALVESYARAAGLFRAMNTRDPDYDEIVEFDLATVEASLAGPSRPQDRVALNDVTGSFRGLLQRPLAEGGFAVPRNQSAKRVAVEIGGANGDLRHGSLAIAAITSCTNTSNPSVMLAAGLLAKRAVEAGLRSKPWVKTSLAPGSRVVTRYLEQSGLLPYLEKLGFHVVGYGCTTCSGKSGPLLPEVSQAAERTGLVLAAVLSGNRNFSGRIHRQVRANYLASPPLVVAFALAGSIDIDLTCEPLGRDDTGRPIFLDDVWPRQKEIDALLASTRRAEDFRDTYATVFSGSHLWRSLEVPSGPLYSWLEDSTYILEPPFYSLEYLEQKAAPQDRLEGARALCLFGDSLTTDHISPAGEIAPDSPAGRFLTERGVGREDYNAFTMRRGNHHVMARGTFAAPRIKNRLVPQAEGGVTVKYPDRRVISVYDAAMAYREEKVPVIVLAGKDYGMGSSRDWAAKGPALLGLRAVIARSFERIHRSNLIGMGIVPLLFVRSECVDSLGLDGSETYDVSGIVAGIESQAPIAVTARRADETEVAFSVRAAVTSDIEVEYLRNGGIFQTVFQRLLARAADNLSLAQERRPS